MGMELIDVYNVRHEKLNYTKERGTLEKGEYQLTCLIWIVNDEEKILLQQRASTLKHSPNIWGATAGAALAGDTSLTGALRELKEELGIDVPKEEMIFIGSYQRIDDFVEIWLCKKNINIEELTINQDEVKTVKWFTIDEFEQIIKEGKGSISGFETLKNYYKNYYNKR
jgi:8-oxo-dGTP diphosphatase